VRGGAKAGETKRYRPGGLLALSIGGFFLPGIGLLLIWPWTVVVARRERRLGRRGFLLVLAYGVALFGIVGWIAVILAKLLGYEG
jgi:uncharacterized membrane protein YhaH (DUF805 family)